MTESEFEEIQERFVLAWHQGNLSEAFAEIERVVREGTPEMKGQSLFYRGLIRQSEGSLVDAKHDWLDALEHARAGSFLRYQLEHEIEETYEKSHTPDEALDWYRKALKTCSVGGEFSANQTLAAFLRLNGTKISAEDYALVNSALETSWRVLGLAGEPNLRDLPASIDALSVRFKEMVDNARVPNS